jgi:hypothetical protein
LKLRKLKLINNDVSSCRSTGASKLESEPCLHRRGLDLDCASPIMNLKLIAMLTLYWSSEVMLSSRPSAPGKIYIALAGPDTIQSFTNEQESGHKGRQYFSYMRKHSRSNDGGNPRKADMPGKILHAGYYSQSAGGYTAIFLKRIFNHESVRAVTRCMRAILTHNSFVDVVQARKGPEGNAFAMDSAPRSNTEVERPATRYIARRGASPACASCGATAVV